MTTYQRTNDTGEIYFANTLIAMIEAIQMAPVIDTSGTFADGWHAALTSMAVALGYTPTPERTIWIEHKTQAVTPARRRF